MFSPPASPPVPQPELQPASAPAASPAVPVGYRTEPQPGSGSLRDPYAAGPTNRDRQDRHARAVSRAHDREPRIETDPAPSGRVARLTVSSIDLWSVFKISLMLSVASGVALVIAVSVLWTMLKGIGVFDQLNSVLGDVSASGKSTFDIYRYVGFNRVLSISVLIATVNVVLLMALSIVTALIYNLASGLVGGLRVTLSDD